MVAPIHNFDPKWVKKKAWPPWKTPQNGLYVFCQHKNKTLFPHIARRINEAAMGGAGAEYLIFMASVVHWIEKSLSRGRPEFVSFFKIYFRGSNKKQRSCDGRGGAQRPVWLGNEPKKTGALSARARTRGQNPLVSYISWIFLVRSVLPIHAGDFGASIYWRNDKRDVPVRSVFPIR